MTKLLSILLSLMILAQNMGLVINDIVKLDELVSHAIMHNDKYGDSLIDFVSKHYGEQKAAHAIAHQEEKGDHDKLPFNHTGHCHVIAITAIVHTPAVIEIRNPKFVDDVTANFYYHSPISSLHTSGLLQPPRFS